MLASRTVGGTLDSAGNNPTHPMTVDYGRLTIHISRFWIWRLHPNQSYLGRTLFVLRRDLQTSCAECTEAEWISLRLQLVRYERFMAGLFQPDRFNYSQLGNEWPHVHVHAIPRYETSRQWEGVEFKDTRWGKNPSPKPASPITIEETYRLATLLRSVIERVPAEREESARWGGSDVQ